MEIKKGNGSQDYKFYIYRKIDPEGSRYRQSKCGWIVHYKCLILSSVMVQAISDVHIHVETNASVAETVISKINLWLYKITDNKLF